MSTILITGGSGLIGTALVPMLLEAGHDVRIIGRSVARKSAAPAFKWDIGKMTMDEAALDGVTHIIHLAGAGIADERWTDKRKQEILESRVMPMKLLADTLKKRGQRLEAFITASGIGYYGAVTTDIINKEEHAPANDFLGKTCQLWEEAVCLFDDITDREVRLRTGIVLDPNGGALAKLMLPARFGMAASLGSGRQWMPWVHIEDMCRIYKLAIENNAISGAFNAVAPQHATQEQMLSAISNALDKPFFLPGVPKMLTRLAMSDMALMLTEGSRVSSSKLEGVGFLFRYPELNAALDSLI